MSEPAQNRKKDWAKPRMTVLSRKKPEEAVLTGCKGSWDSSGDNDFNSACFFDDIAICEWCDAYASS